ncbi:MAG: IS66 family transposase zinc-finger binding domain-containing protein [Deltaproteobacteria bacterium]|nr:IS66 family transposase zinc-finger binding domain-containing protein [Deltaproteobacteria bacterium]
MDDPVCPDCGGRLNHVPADDELGEQHEIPPQSLRGILHRVKGHVCEGCGHRIPTGQRP